MSEHSPHFNQLLQGLALLGEALGKSAKLQTHSSRSQAPPDLSVTVFLRDQKYNPILTLVPVDELHRPSKWTSNRLVLVANRVPPQTALRWRASGQSFIDLSGSVYLEAPGLLVDKQVQRPRLARRVRTKAVDPFADRASNISRYLLKEPPGTSLGVRELASVADVSLGTASKIVGALEDRELVVVERLGRNAAVSVEKPGLLFKAWAIAYDWSRNSALKVRAPVGDPKDFVRLLPRRMAAIKTKWALTMHAGAELLGTHAIWKQVHLYVNGSSATALEKFAADLNWAPAPDGRVTLMLPYYRTSMWSDVHMIGGTPVVDPLQLALDLWNYPARGRDQAEYLLRRSLPWITDKRD